MNDTDVQWMLRHVIAAKMDQIMAAAKGLSS
jgi:hypothetical protein